MIRDVPAALEGCLVGMRIHGIRLLGLFEGMVWQHAILFNSDGVVFVRCVGDCVAIAQEIVAVVLAHKLVPQARVL